VSLILAINECYSRNTEEIFKECKSLVAIYNNLTLLTRSTDADKVFIYSIRGIIRTFSFGAY
jgi:hypothetical protein